MDLDQIRAWVEARAPDTREQLRARRAGEAVTNSVRLEHLSPVERQHLKDVFVAIRELQSATALRHSVA